MSISDRRYNYDYKRGLRYQEFIAAYFGVGSGLEDDFEEANDLEIKLDDKYAKTGNLFIETAERPTTKFPWKPAGPFHPYPKRSYLIGDRKKAWVFDNTQLKNLISNRSRVTNASDTAIGVLMPVYEASEIARIFKFTAEKGQLFLPVAKPWLWA